MRSRSAPIGTPPNPIFQVQYQLLMRKSAWGPGSMLIHSEGLFRPRAEWLFAWKMPVRARRYAFCSLGGAAKSLLGYSRRSFPATNLGVKSRSVSHHVNRVGT